MSYQFSRESMYNPEEEEDYKNLDEERKQQILRELQQDMERLKVKYMIDEKDKKAKKNSQEIHELDTLSGREINREHYNSDYDQVQMLEKENSVLGEESNFQDVNQHPNKNVNPNNFFMSGEIEDEEMHLDQDEVKYNQIEEKNNFEYEYNQINELESINKFSNTNTNRDTTRNVKMENKDYEVFDKAKQNLLKIKNELDDMDQYDYRNVKTKKEKSEIQVNEDYIEEEQPKNLEHEISMSMSKSIREDSIYGNGGNNAMNLSQTNSQYKFANPYTAEINHFNAATNTCGYNFTPIPQITYRDFEMKRQKNNYMPITYQDNQNSKMNKNLLKNQKKLTRPSSSSKNVNTASSGYLNLNRGRKASANKIPTNHITNPYTSQSASGSKERKMSPYFKKMIKEYNPKYKSKERFEKIKSEVEKKFEQEHTFKPNINYTNVFSNVEKYNESKEDVYKRLSQPKTIEINKRMKEKESADRQKMREECTFKPNANTKEETVERDEERVAREKVENRLYKLAEQMKEKREKLKREHQDNLIKDYSFSPGINETSKKLVLKYEKKPLHERYEEIVENKKHNLQNLRIQSEKQEKSFYKPNINPKSIEIIMNKTDRSFTGEGKSIHERLYKEALNKNNQRGRDILDSELEQCTFSPNLYYSTTQPGGNIDDFLERQKIYEELKKERLERKLSKSIEHTKYTFTPKINLTSDILMKADHSRSNEDIKDKVERLYKEDFEKMRNRKEQLEKFYYAQYDFKPKINEISRFVGRDHTYEELSNHRESSKSRKIRDDKNKGETDLCTFKPKINKDKYTNVQSSYKSDENILKRIKSEVKFKNEKIEEIKNLMEEKSLQECKFQPEINRELPNYEVKEPIMMKGFSRYLEQMERARKAKRDKEEREKEVFISGENWSRDNLITIPKPFKLSHQKINKERKDSKAKFTKDQEMRECTFKPVTNES